MKKLILSIFTLCMGAMNSMAAIITVSNNTNSPGQYTSLQDAIDAANPNDTIYIHASAISYGSANVWKPLVLIGEGALPNQQMELRSEVDYLHIGHNNSDTNYSSGAGSKIYGLRITAGVYLYRHFTSPGTIGNLVFERNILAGVLHWETILEPATNLVFRHNVLGIFGMMCRNSFFTNNIIYDFISITNSENVENNLVANNNFIFGGSGVGCNGKGMIIANNIFYSLYAINNSFETENSVYTNNLFYTLTTPTLITGTTTATGNLFGQDPQFLVAPVASYPYSGPLIKNYDYTTQVPFADLHLQAGSPGKNYGTDGTDVGIYGGSTPWPDGEGGGVYRYFPMPSQVPYVISMDVLNPTIPQNGTLNINFNARVQD